MHKLTLVAATLLFASSPSLAAPIKAVASFSILGDMVQRVGGDRIELTTIVGPNADTHVYEPKPSDAAALKSAQLFFVNGLGFEGWLNRLVEATRFAGTVVTASEGVKTHQMDEDGETVTDPHAWQSLGNGVLYVENIRAALCVADADGCATYTANAATYTAEIEALDKDVRAQIDTVPAADRKVITSHDAFGYFAEAYGVEFLAPEGISTESEASAADVAKLIQQVRQQGAKALFIENMADPRLIRQIADETGAKLGGALYADALSTPDEGAATYLDMFRHNIALLVPAMLGR